jgi:hypothetical protein
LFWELVAGALLSPLNFDCGSSDDSNFVLSDAASVAEHEEESLCFVVDVFFFAVGTLVVTVSNVEIREQRPPGQPLI